MIQKISVTSGTLLRLSCVLAFTSLSLGRQFSNLPWLPSTPRVQSPSHRPRVFLPGSWSVAAKAHATLELRPFFTRQANQLMETYFLKLRVHTICKPHCSASRCKRQ